MAKETQGALVRMLRGGRNKPSIQTDALRVLDAYVEAAPSRQHAIDMIPGWNHAFPPEYEVTAGPAHMHEDSRIHWAVEQFGGLEGKTVLELGPLEGAHTALMERLGARRLDAVEANKLAYLRCLIAKEIYWLRRSRFHLGDFVAHLETDRRRHDLIVACGVLYHMKDPPRLLELIAARTNAVYIWTHYFSEEAMPPGDRRRVAFRSPKPPRQENIREVRFHGLDLTLRERSYHKAWEDSAFCGGPIDLHYWMEKSEILAALRALGFDDIRVAHDDPEHVNGPAMSIFARRGA
jgi:hypothetical protein